MICRNCSALVPDDCEICPSCGHDPAKRGRSRKTAVIVTLLSLIIFSSCVMIAVKINRNPPGTTATAETSSYASSETAFFALKETSVQDSSTTIPDNVESRTEINLTETTEKFSGFTVEAFEIADPADGIKSERALIKADKADFYENGEEYIEYICRSIIQKNNYAWLTIDFGDSTGIVFLSDNTGGADYGKIDENGLISELFGSFIISRQSHYSYFSVFSSAGAVTQETGEAQNTQPDETSAAFTTGEQTSTTGQVITETVPPKTTEKTTQAKTSEAKVTKEKTEVQTSETAPEIKTTKSAAVSTKSSNGVSDSAVYITATGSKYHRADCASLSKSKIKIDRSEAINKGYEPCKKCNP